MATAACVCSRRTPLGIHPGTYRYFSVADPVAHTTGLKVQPILTVSLCPGTYVVLKSSSQDSPGTPTSTTPCMHIIFRCTRCSGQLQRHGHSVVFPRTVDGAIATRSALRKSGIDVSWTVVVDLRIARVSSWSSLSYTMRNLNGAASSSQSAGYKRPVT